MSKDKITLRIMTAQGVMEEGEYFKIVAEGADGYFGVLPGHISFITPLVPGVICASTADGDEEEGEDVLFAVHGGFCEVHDNRVLVLATVAERREQIDEERAKLAEERARERLSDKARKDVDFARAEIALKRALVRLRTANGNAVEE